MDHGSLLIWEMHNPSLGPFNYIFLQESEHLKLPSESNYQPCCKVLCFWDRFVSILFFKFHLVNNVMLQTMWKYSSIGLEGCSYFFVFYTRLSNWNYFLSGEKVTTVEKIYFYSSILVLMKMLAISFCLVWQVVTIRGTWFCSH